MCVPGSKHVLDEEAKELRNKCAFWLGQDKDVQPRTGLQFFMRADTYSTTLLHCCTTGILVLFILIVYVEPTTNINSVRRAYHTESTRYMKKGIKNDKKNATLR